MEQASSQISLESLAKNECFQMLQKECAVFGYEITQPETEKLLVSDNICLNEYVAIGGERSDNEFVEKKLLPLFARLSAQRVIEWDKLYGPQSKQDPSWRVSHLEATFRSFQEYSIKCLSQELDTCFAKHLGTSAVVTMTARTPQDRIISFWEFFRWVERIVAELDNVASLQTHLSQNMEFMLRLTDRTEYVYKLNLYDIGECCFLIQALCLHSTIATHARDFGEKLMLAYNDVAGKYSCRLSFGQFPIMNGDNRFVATLLKVAKDEVTFKEYRYGSEESGTIFYDLMQDILSCTPASQESAKKDAVAMLSRTSAEIASYLQQLVSE